MEFRIDFHIDNVFMIFIIVKNQVCLLTFTHILLHCSALFSKFELTYVYINSYPIYSVCPISIVPFARIYFGMSSHLICTLNITTWTVVEWFGSRYVFTFILPADLP